MVASISCRWLSRHRVLLRSQGYHQLSCRRLVVERRHQREPRWPDIGKGFLKAVNSTNPSYGFAFLQREVSQILERVLLQPIQQPAESFAHSNDAPYAPIIGEEVQFI